MGVGVSKIREAKTAKGSVPKGEGKRGILSEEGRFQNENLGRETEMAKTTRGPTLGPTWGDQGETSEENLGTEQLPPLLVSAVRS